MQEKKISVGIILYYSEKYLAFLLNSLKNQSLNEIEFLFLDNTNNQSNDYNYLKKYLKNFKYFAKDNLGFSKGHNFLIAQSKNRYYACLNPDIYYEKEYLKNCLNSFSKNTASVTGKIYQWQAEKDFKNKKHNQLLGKTKIIDTTGIILTDKHQFLDRGQGEKDFNQYDNKNKIFGVSGAASVFDKEYLNKIKDPHIFDEKIFMYKEDCDLAYRLNQAGFNSYFCKNAIAYHHRTQSSKTKNYWQKHLQKKEEGFLGKFWSYSNQLYLFKKHFSFNWSTKKILKSSFYHLSFIIYLLIFETKLSFKIFLKTK
jgi:GT2 family glycosyltransferase